jgi:O-antigen ligase
MGVGAGGTTVAVQKFAGEWYVHNLYIQVLTEFGPVGLALLLVAIGTTYAAALRAARRAANWKERIAAISIAAAVIYYATTGVVGWDFTEMEIWMLMAIATAIPGAEKIPVAHALPRPQASEA